MITNVSSIDFAVDEYGQYDKYDFPSKLGWLLGFRLPSYSFPSPTSITSENSVNLNNIRYLYLVLDEYTSSFTNSFTAPMFGYLMNKKIIAKISIDNIRYPPGTSIIVATESNGLLVSDIRQYNQKTNIQKLSVQLVNEWGVVVDLNGQDFSFVILLHTL